MQFRVFKQKSNESIMVCCAYCNKELDALRSWCVNDRDGTVIQLCSDCKFTLDNIGNLQEVMVEELAKYLDRIVQPVSGWRYVIYLNLDMLVHFYTIQHPRSPIQEPDDEASILLLGSVLLTDVEADYEQHHLRAWLESEAFRMWSSLSAADWLKLAERSEQGEIFKGMTVFVPQQ